MLKTDHKSRHNYSSYITFMSYVSINCFLKQIHELFRRRRIKFSFAFIYYSFEANIVFGKSFALNSKEKLYKNDMNFLFCFSDAFVINLKQFFVFVTKSHDSV